MRKNKRGSTSIQETLIFIILNVVFFVSVLVFVGKAGSGALYYEQLYAKQVALYMDQAEPNMTLMILFEDPLSMAKRNGQPIENIIKFDSTSNKVRVSLDPRARGYSYEHYSNLSVSYSFQGKYLVIKTGRENNG